jgi:hypothetical protein
MTNRSKWQSVNQTVSLTISILVNLSFLNDLCHDVVTKIKYFSIWEGFKGKMLGIQRGQREED